MRLSTLVRRITAPNPSLLTGAGTNTYLVGAGDVAVIDPGPDDTRHLQAILESLKGERISRILLTHTHADHAPGAVRLAGETRALVAAFPRWDQSLRDRAILRAGGATLQALHTPGHSADHLCFLLREEQALFSGDLIMSGSTVVIAPPEGDMAAYLGSLERVRQLTLARIYPGHGDVIETPQAAIDQYLAHRRMREQQVLEALRHGPARIPDLVRRIYTDVPEELHPYAALSVHAHLLKLKAERRVLGEQVDAEWRLIQ